jgi:hypothetical protein
MVEVTPEEMDRLLKERNDKLWPLRFDCNRRVWPLPWHLDITIYSRDDWV